MRVAEFESGGAEVVAVVGDLDCSSAPQLSRVLEHAIERRDAPLLVDLTDTSFLDSLGIATIVAASASADRRGSHLAVVVPEDCHIRRLLSAVDDAGLSLAASRSQALLQ